MDLRESINFYSFSYFQLIRLIHSILEAKFGDNPKNHVFILLI